MKTFCKHKSLKVKITEEMPKVYLLIYNTRKTNRKFNKDENIHERVKEKLKGIQRDKTMANKLMYIPNVNSQNYPFVDYNYIRIVRIMNSINQPIKIH